MKVNKNKNQQSSREKLVIKELLADLFFILAGLFALTFIQTEVVKKLGVVAIIGGLVIFAAIVFINVSRVNKKMNSDSKQGTPELMNE